MAKTIKLDNALEKRMKRKENPDKRADKNIRANILILCEGEKTEPNYFKCFKKNQNISINCPPGKGLSPSRLVEKAKEAVEKFDSIWVVFDKDSVPKNQFNGAILQAKQNQIKCAWTNEAFELWYLLHFHDRITAMDRNEYKKAIEKAVNKEIANKKNTKQTNFVYQKNAEEMYKVLQAYGDQEKAIKRAKDLADQNTGEQFADYNPQTMVFELVEELNGTSQKFNEELMSNFR
jgi:hypothetical protein